MRNLKVLILIIGLSFLTVACGGGRSGGGGEDGDSGNKNKGVITVEALTDSNGNISISDSQGSPLDIHVTDTFNNAIPNINTYCVSDSKGAVIIAVDKSGRHFPEITIVSTADINHKIQMIPYIGNAAKSQITNSVTAVVQSPAINQSENYEPINSYSISFEGEDAQRILDALDKLPSEPAKWKQIVAGIWDKYESFDNITTGITVISGGAPAAPKVVIQLLIGLAVEEITTSKYDKYKMNVYEKEGLAILMNDETIATGYIQGQVRDANERGITNALISINNCPNFIEYQPDGSGFYLIDNVIPGTYTVVATELSQLTINHNELSYLYWGKGNDINIQYLSVADFGQASNSGEVQLGQTTFIDVELPFSSFISNLSPTLEYRKAGETSFHSVTMKTMADTNFYYEATIPGSYITADIEYRFKVSYADEVTISPIYMTKIIDYGYLYITSTPTNAEIYVDKWLGGLLTPFKLQVIPGQHTVQVRKDGYEPPSSKTVSVSTSRTTEVHFNFSNTGGNILFHDNFDRPDYDDVSSFWDEYKLESTLRIKDNRLIEHNRNNNSVGAIKINDPIDLSNGIVIEGDVGCWIQCGKPGGDIFYIAIGAENTTSLNPASDKGWTPYTSNIIFKIEINQSSIIWQYNKDTDTITKLNSLYEDVNPVGLPVHFQFKLDTNSYQLSISDSTGIYTASGSHNISFPSNIGYMYILYYGHTWNKKWYLDNFVLTKY